MQVVEYHAQEASCYVDKGTGNLDKANQHKKSAMKVIVILWQLYFR